MTGPETKPPCKRCTGLNGACYLTCPTLRLPAGYSRADDSSEAAQMLRDHRTEGS